MQQIAVMVGEDLDFEVARTWQIFFKENGGVAEGGVRLALGFFKKSIKLRGVMYHAHASATAAHRRFHDDGITDLARNFLRLGCRLEGILGSWKNGNARRRSQSSSGGLVPKQLKKLGGRTNEGDAGLFAGAGKRGILRKKTITWVDGVDALFFRERDDSRDVQVGFDGAFAGPDLVGFVCFKAMQGQPIFLRVDGHSAQAELVGGAKDTYGDFAAIGGGE